MTPTLWVLACYPPSFTERYGSELAAVTEDVGPGGGRFWDLVRGAALAWCRPALPRATDEGRRRRLQATVATSWLSWCAGALVAPAVSRDLLDPPAPGVTATARSWLDVGQAAFGAGLAVGAVGALLLAVRVLLPALRRRDRHVLRPLVPLVALGLVEAVGLVPFVLLQAGHPATWQPSPTLLLFAAIWLLGFLVLCAVAALGPVVCLTRARPDLRVLRPAVWLTVPLAGCLAAAVVASLLAEVESGAARPVSLAVIGFAAAAAVVGSVSSVRGLRAVRPSPV